MTDASPPWSRSVVRQAPTTDWSVLVGRRRLEFASREGVERWLRTGSRSALVAEPGSTEFVPIPSLRSLRAREGRRFPALLVGRAIALAVAGAILLAGAFATRRLELLGLGGGALALAALLGIDARVLGSSERALTDRLRFLHWCETDASVRRLRLLALGFLVAVGVGQWVAQEVLGSMGRLWDAFGLVYEQVSVAEGWRFLTGPFLHYDVAHFAVNAVLLFLLTGFVQGAAPRMAVSAFLAACAIAAFAQYSLGGREFGNFGGISGGVYALFGLAASRGDRLPAGVPFLLVGLAMVCIASAEVISAHAATTAHLAGLLAGGWMGGLARWSDRRRIPSVSRRPELGRR
jgi:membrane associated rhomboid family serine protease